MAPMRMFVFMSFHIEREWGGKVTNQVHRSGGLAKSGPGVRNVRQAGE